MRKVGLCLAACVMIASLAACVGTAEDNTDASAEVRPAIMTADSVFKETVLFADPQGAADAIYQSLGGNPEITAVEEGAIEKVMGVSDGDVASFVAYVSDAKGGLCDIAIIEPKEEKLEDVREALIRYCTQRAEQFKNFDILNAYSIASNAAVFVQGDYVVMLMLPDNEAAREIIDRYMPQ